MAAQVSPASLERVSPTHMHGPSWCVAQRVRSTPLQTGFEFRESIATLPSGSSSTSLSSSLATMLADSVHVAPMSSDQYEDASSQPGL